MTACCTRDYEKLFSGKMAERDARRFRKRGLRGSAQTLAGLAGDVGGMTVLEVGGGIGAIELELLASGAERAANVELSGAYERSAKQLLAERGLAERVDRHVGDFAVDAAGIDAHDLVVMHRVVCCYPDATGLVGAAAERANRRLLLTYPQDRALIRAAVRLVNAFLRMRGSTFRVFVHPVEQLDAAARAHGLAVTARRRDGFLWESAAFAR